MNMSLSPRLPVLWQLLGFSAAALLGFTQFFVTASAIPQDVPPHEDLHDVISRKPLWPPLRNAHVMLRYSPDGRSLMVQNPSGIYLFSHDPFTLGAYISAEDVYPARFSSDSQTIAVIGYGLKLNREKIPYGPHLEQRELPFHEACLDEEFAPGADLFACLLPDFNLVVYQLSTNQVIFSDSAADVPYSANRIVLVPLHSDTAFPGPFGFRLANDWGFLAGRGMNFLSLKFSPDGQTLLVKNNSVTFSVNLATHRRTSLPGAVQRRLQSSFCLLDDDRVLIASSDKETGPVIMSLKSGEVLASPSFKADNVRIARNPRYLLLSDDGTIGDRVFDLQENREFRVPDNLSVDILRNEMALLNDRGTLFLYHLGEILPFRDADLPLDSLPVLRSASVTPSLDRLAFSLDGNAAVFETGTGDRIYTAPSFSAVTFSGQSSAYFLLPKRLDVPPRMVQLKLSTNKLSDAWSGGKDQLYSGGTVLLEYASDKQLRFRIGANQENDIPYRLRALDTATGQELWKRQFLENSPVPFADPQGDRLVLAWNADSPGAEEAAKRLPAVWQLFKKAKRAKLDTYFEVLDALSGQPVGGVLMQRGSGPYSFDAAFSVGDALFLVRDGRRISVLSLQDGSERAQIVGGIPAANAQSNLFAFEEGPGRLFICDLATGAKLAQHSFPHAIAYTHFSADGNRLFVLTKYQLAYILDVSSLRHIQPPASAPAPR
ncbi:MAG: hypothetical protein WA621_00670 [Candidatus Acidiferrum sp.]